MNVLPDVIRVRVPSGFRDAVAPAAEREGLSLSAYVRRAVLVAAMAAARQQPDRSSGASAS
jgi:hypothetical protein